MLKEELWERFTASGSIADYLQFAAEKGSNCVADSEGSCADPETGR